MTRPPLTDVPPQGADDLPDATRIYLLHIRHGIGIRDLARRTGLAPSTVSRRLARIEDRRGDPLLDEALDHTGAMRAPGPLPRPVHPPRAAAAPASPPAHHPGPAPGCRDAGPATAADPDPAAQDRAAMTKALRSPITADEAEITREARRILRRLCESGAILALADGLDRAVVLRPGPDGGQTRTAVVDRKIAGTFAVRDWIRAERGGKVTTYVITEAGQAALKRLLAEDRRRKAQEASPADTAAVAGGMAEAASPFAAQHRVEGRRAVRTGDGMRRDLPVNLAESPLAALARRKGPDGKPFLSLALVQAGEKLREDFERAQMGPRIAQNWERFLTAGSRGAGFGDGGPAAGPAGARARVAEAVEALGPGLSDVVLRVCCFLEGLEATEKRLGWSSRSGKIVLKIALQRLEAHYRDRYGYVPALRD